MPKIITVTSDFGTSDPYVGIMKGMILSSNPAVTIIDITHEVPSHDIISGAFTIARACKYFPSGTIHIAVVDPGVGGSRKNIAVLTSDYIFIGPDNGVLSAALSKETVKEIREITSPPFLTTTVSETFHGRDVYAPCAGHLSTGADFSGIGPLLDSITQLSAPDIIIDKNEIRGEVISIDSFGNMITNISEQVLEAFAGEKGQEIYFGSERFETVKKHYEGVPKGSALAIIGSFGYLEIAMNEKSAAKFFMASAGFPVLVRRR